MPKTSYISMDGMLIGEITGGVMRNYGTDALGSVMDTASNGVAENTYRYKPYGGTLAKTGTAADPSFLWNGGSGYRATSLSNSGLYVRNRHFSLTSAQWTIADPLWPVESPYAYVQGNPVSAMDWTGLCSAVGATSPSPHCNANNLATCCQCTASSSVKCSGFTLQPSPLTSSEGTNKTSKCESIGYTKPALSDCGANNVYSIVVSWDDYRNNPNGVETSNSPTRGTCSYSIGGKPAKITADTMCNFSSCYNAFKLLVEEQITGQFDAAQYPPKKVSCTMTITMAYVIRCLTPPSSGSGSGSQ